VGVASVTADVFICPLQHIYQQIGSGSRKEPRAVGAEKWRQAEAGRKLPDAWVPTHTIAWEWATNQACSSIVVAT
jgi:hypothetical protein